jgi:hypothetical protein
MRCGIAVLAAERFRRAKGRWPSEVAELVPKFLPKTPIDPYDGKPLRLRRDQVGIVIYSIGPDLQDDGGLVNRDMPMMPGYDLGFQLWDVEHRRQPAVNPEIGPPLPTEEDLERAGDIEADFDPPK